MADPIIENEHLFHDALKRGINLFLGAGFSCLATDKQKNPLPTGGQLQIELVKHFNRPALRALPLPKLAFILLKEEKDGFYEFLTNRFSVSQYDAIYANLLRIRVNRIFTTNIDDLIPQVYAASSTSYLHDIAIHGACYDKVAIPYFPLHGCVTHSEKRYTFTPTEIAAEFSKNPDDWYLLRREIYENDTLFWGYRMEDADVLQSLADPPIPSPAGHKWIVLRNPEEDEKTYFQTLGFQIIEGDTQDLLRYLGSVDTPTTARDIDTSDLKRLFPKDVIPRFGQVPSRPIREFFLGASPTWSDIFSSFLYSPSVSLTIKNKILSGRNVVLVGLPLSGKTTLLMQIATSMQTDKIKLFMELVTSEKAAMTVRALGDRKCIIFIDNFVDSIDAISTLVQHGVQVVATERAYTLDAVYHRIPRRLLDIVNVTELSAADAQAIYNTIPLDIRSVNFKKSVNFKRDAESRQESVFEIIDNNVSLGRIRQRLRRVLKQLQKEDREAHDMLVMMSYVHECRTVVSYDMTGRS
jgi:hypothetical protein